MAASTSSGWLRLNDMRESRNVDVRMTTLQAAEKRTFEMIADGASLRDVLDQLCDVIAVQVTPSVTTVLLVDDNEKCLPHGGGLGVSSDGGSRSRCMWEWGLLGGTGCSARCRHRTTLA